MAAPATAVASLLLWPFWNWFEAITGIEAAGHSGPADWTIFLVYGLIGGSLQGSAIYRGRKTRR